MDLGAGIESGVVCDEKGCGWGRSECGQGFWKVRRDSGAGKRTEEGG
jgi:hypothetical protein